MATYRVCHEDFSARSHDDDIWVCASRAVNHNVSLESVPVLQFDIRPHRQAPRHLPLVIMYIPGFAGVQRLRDDGGCACGGTSLIQDKIEHTDQLALLQPELEHLRSVGFQQNFDLLFHFQYIGMGSALDLLAG